MLSLLTKKRILPTTSYISVYTSFNGSEKFYTFSQVLGYIKEVAEEEEINLEDFSSHFEVCVYSGDDERFIRCMDQLTWLAEEEEI